MEEYYHLSQVPEILMDYLIDLKCEIDMGDYSPEQVVEMKKEFNRRTKTIGSIKPYSL